MLSLIRLLLPPPTIAYLSVCFCKYHPNAFLNHPSGIRNEKTATTTAPQSNNPGYEQQRAHPIRRNYMGKLSIPNHGHYSQYFLLARHPSKSRKQHRPTDTQICISVQSDCHWLRIIPNRRLITPPASQEAEEGAEHSRGTRNCLVL